jgi:hypothetical protein
VQLSLVSVLRLDAYAGAATPDLDEFMASDLFMIDDDDKSEVA